MTLKTTFDAWCLVELFGHARIAGKCTEENIAGANFLRVDVPETSTQPALTRFFGAAAIYAINPIDEHTARHMAAALQVKPIDSWNISEVMKKYQQQNLLEEELRASTGEDDETPDEEPLF